MSVGCRARAVSAVHLQRGHQQIELVVRHAVGVQFVEHASDALFEHVHGAEVAEHEQGQAGENAVPVFPFGEQTPYRVQRRGRGLLKTINQPSALYLYIHGSRHVSTVRTERLCAETDC